MNKDFVVVNGEKKEIYPIISKEEIEDNSDLFDELNLEDTLDLTEVLENE